jgi:6-phosphogluconolactonase (cycloisomerase 2 family)
MATKRVDIMRPALVLLLCGSGLLGGCKKEDPALTYTVGGTVAGLSGSVTLANNGGDARTVAAAGAFSFATSLATGATYNVTVTTQPANQTCTVASGSGTVASANVSGVSVTCVTNTFTVGGSVTGLVGSGLTLQNNGADNLARTADGAFTFATPVVSGGAYSVTVLSQPATPAQTCTATNQSGTIAANVTNVTVTCVTNVAIAGRADIGPAGGTVNGFYGAQIIVPPGALPNTVTIGLSRDSSNSPAYAVPETDAVGATYELTPHGQAFTVPVTVRIPFDPAQVSNDSVPQLYKAEAGGTFAALPTTVNGNFLEANVTGFSWVIPAAQATRPRMVYAVENAAGALSLNSYRINRTTGALSASTSSAPVGDFPLAAISHPSGRFVYLTNAGSNTLNGIAPNSIATYSVNAVNGQLAGPATSSVTTRGPAGYKPTMPAIHPSGKFLYVMNYGNAVNDGGDIDKFTINGATGALTMTGPAVSGGGAQPMGVAFDRLGTRAYVLYAGSSSSNTFSSKVVLYDVNLMTGEFSAPVSSTAACVLGGAPWSIALDPNYRSAHVACLSTNELWSYSVNATTGALSSMGSIAVLRKPASLAADSFGRFIFASKQEVLIPGNVMSYRMDSTTGALSLVNGLYSGCPGGACGGPTSIVADPQGNFVYAIDTTGGLTAFDVNATTGALTSVASRTGAWVPTIGGVGTPFRFAVSGTSPVWQSSCMFNCALVGVLTGAGGGGGGGSPPTNPDPPATHYLTVTIGPFFGSVSSTPAGIDYAPPSNANPLGRPDFSADFPASSIVTLCATEPPTGRPYDITWTGSCSGTGWCTSVKMDSDRNCHAEFSPVAGR